MDANTRTKKLMNKYFKKGTYRGEKGWYGYKIFETKGYPYAFDTPKHWIIEKGERLTLKKGEILNTDTNKHCARGIYFATFEWIQLYGDLTSYEDTMVFKVFVPQSNIKHIIVPHHQDYCIEDIKVRTDFLTLIHQL